MMNPYRDIVAVLMLVLVLHVAARAAAAEQDRQPAALEGRSMWCFIGTTASEPPHQSRGIYVSRFDPETGKLTTPALAAEAAAPSFLALHPSGKFLYAAREATDGQAAAFAIDRASGKLAPLNAQSS